MRERAINPGKMSTFGIKKLVLAIPGIQNSSREVVSEWQRRRCRRYSQPIYEHHAEYTLYSWRQFYFAVKLFTCSIYWPLKESSTLECCLAISFMHFPEYLMLFWPGLGQ